MQILGMELPPEQDFHCRFFSPPGCMSDYEISR